MNSTTQLQINRNTTATSNLETILIDLNLKTRSTKTTFDRLFIDAIESAFSKLGNANKQTLYIHLENRFGLNKDTIPQNIEFFTSALEYLFRDSALLLEIQIMEALRRKVPQFRYSPKDGVLSFNSYVENIRSNCNHP
ncbi:MAG: hypothetical protein M1540_00520 [Candidatus Bathyarchaeota archaeon]|nr:hypothetical protein [Chloroflexota bacterium]MCL5876282.1 hypothetical protein [Candidatus Bathyarchaeota archaeon]